MISVQIASIRQSVSRHLAINMNESGASTRTISIIQFQCTGPTYHCAVLVAVANSRGQELTVDEARQTASC